MRGPEPVIAWIVAFAAGQLCLGGYGWYLCRGPRKHRVADEEIALLEVLAETERGERTA